MNKLNLNNFLNILTTNIMNMRFSFLIAMLLISFAIIGQSTDDKHKERYDAQKIAYITTKLELSSDEAKLFWPIYNKYQEEFDGLRNKKDMNSFSNEMSNEEAQSYLDQRTKIEEQYMSIKKRYYADLKKAVSVKKIAMLTVAEREFRNEMMSKVKKRLTNKGQKK